MQLAKTDIQRGTHTVKTAIATVHIMKGLDERIFKNGGGPAFPTRVP